MTIIHLTKLKKGYSLRIEWKNKYQEFDTFDKLVETLRKEFGEGDGRSE